MQTTIIYEPGCALELTGFEAAPVCPRHYRDLPEPVSIELNDGTKIYWMHSQAEGIIRRYELNGRLTLWYKKPTPAEAICGAGKGQYFRFYADGCTEARWYGANYYWSTHEEGTWGGEEELQGYVEVAHRCTDGSYRFEEDCEDRCNYYPKREDDEEGHDYEYEDDGYDNYQTDSEDDVWSCDSYVKRCGGKRGRCYCHERFRRY